MPDPALLLVDDRPENLVTLEAVLGPLGHRMVQAGSGDEALRHLLVDEVAVIVLDVEMPGMDGYETAAAVKGRERTRDIPIIFLTAADRDPQRRMLGYAAGAVDYLLKPVDADLLRAKVTVFVDLHLAQRRLQEQTELLARRTAELERSNADLEQFSYLASHDLQEPLRVVTGYLELIAEELGEALPDRVTRWIERAFASATRMEQLVDDLLVYARSGAGEGTLEAVDLDEALAAAISDVQPLVDGADAAIQSAPLGLAMGSVVSVRRVFQNLLANSIRYRSPDRPVIGVTSSLAGDEVEVCVTDNGVGVPEVDLRRVFGMFERVAGQPYPGTGLGLAVCRRLVERWGGRIWMDRNPGAGVTVHFTLPSVDR
jgi:two-component system sensor histidine kinase/response regulator